MADLENRVSNLETKVSVIETKVDTFIQEMRDFKTEMRDRDNQRAAEIAALRKTHEADMKEIRTKQEADMKEIRASIDSVNNKIDGMGKHVRNLAVAAIVGIGAIVVAVIGFIATK